MTPRHDLLETLGQHLLSRRAGHPLRVAIDGPLASGKTTLADDLAEAVQTRAPAIRAGLDGFHRPRAERYARGRRSALGYYEDARDYAALRRALLDPLGPGGSGLYRTGMFDLDNDRPAEAPLTPARADAILIVEGTFLQRPEFDGAWDVVVFLDIDPELSLARGLSRDSAALGGPEAAAELYRERYLPAWAMYAAACRPRERADVVIDHRDFQAPDIVRMARP